MKLPESKKGRLAACPTFHALSQRFLGSRTTGSMNIYCITTLAITLIIGPLLQTANAASDWSNSYGDSSVESNDKPATLAVDGDGNVIVAGVSSPEPSAADKLIIKYSASGIALWTNRFHGPSDIDDSTTLLTANQAGTLVVAGSSRGRGFAIAFASQGIPLWTNSDLGIAIVKACTADSAGNTYLTGFVRNISSFDFATIKLSAKGEPLWTSYYGGLSYGADYGLAIAPGADGSVFVAGSSYEIGGTTPVCTVIAYDGARGTPIWTNHYAPINNSETHPRALAVATNSSVYVAGYCMSGDSLQDYFTVAWSTDGIPLWTNLYNGEGNSWDGATALTVSPEGKLYVTGSSIGTDNAYDFLTIAYSEAGVGLWTNRCGTPGNAEDRAQAVAVSADGIVFVTGYTITGDKAEYVTVAYAGSGAALWTNRYGGWNGNYSYSQALATDREGEVFVTGYISGIGLGYDWATIAYSDNGTPIWTNVYNGTGLQDNYPQALVLDLAGNAFVTGVSAGAHGDRDFATIAYSDLGVPLWTNRFNGPGNTDDFATTMALDAGQIYVGGGSAGGFATLAYSLSGYSVWTNYYRGRGNGNDYVQALAVDSKSGNIYVTGISLNASSDIVTISYSPTGLPLWTNRYDSVGGQDDVPTAIVVGKSGNVFVTGYSWHNDTRFGYLTLAYSSLGELLWTNTYSTEGFEDDLAFAIALDENDNVYVTGGGSDWATVAYSSLGLPLWTNRFHAVGNGQNVGRAVVVSQAGTVYVAGESSSNGNAAAYDYVTLAYSHEGSALWTNQYNGPQNGEDRATALAVDRNGLIYVTGYSKGGIPNSYDCATLLYAPSGQCILTNRFNSESNFADQPLTKSSLAISQQNSLYLILASGSSKPLSRCYRTLKYSIAPVILSHPVSQVRQLGDAVNFEVEIKGFEPLSPQWLFNGNELRDGIRISGAQSAKLEIRHLSLSDAGLYSVRVTNLVGETISSNASLMVQVPNPSRFTAIGLTTNGAFHLAMDGPLNRTFELQVSTNLIDWAPLTNLVAPPATFDIIDASSYLFPRRFYRAAWSR